jgi:hypothetical protein
MSETITAMCAGSDWLGAIFAFVVLLLLILASAALVKDLFTGTSKQRTP